MTQVLQDEVIISSKRNIVVQCILGYLKIHVNTQLSLVYLNRTGNGKYSSHSKLNDGAGLVAFQACAVYNCIALPDPHFMHFPNRISPAHATVRKVAVKDALN